MENKVGKATLNIKVIVIGRPSAPKDIKVTKVTENSATLTWEKPDTDGGAAITGYVIEKRDPYRQEYKQVGTTSGTDFRVGRLVEGNEYVFQVSAENSVGIGDAAELSQSILTKSPYSEYSFIALICILPECPQLYSAGFIVRRNYFYMPMFRPCSL